MEQNIACRDPEQNGRRKCILELTSEELRSALSRASLGNIPMIQPVQILMLVAVAVLPSQSAPQKEYLALAEATLKRPISRYELEKAVLSDEGVAMVKALFERSIAESLTLDGSVVTPELGGESMLHDDGTLHLVAYPDPIHAVVREVVSRKDRPDQLLAFLEGSAEGEFLLKNTGGLHALLYQLSSAPSTEQRALLDDVIDRMVAQHFKTWMTDPLIQARMIERTEWRGRYVGFWHIHPARVRGESISEGIEPSMADMRNAVELGQFLTFVFQPDGFDAYDLSPLARRRPDLSRVEVIRYRDRDWKRHFESRLRSARGSSVP